MEPWATRTPIHELPQTSGNLTDCAQNLYELIQGRTLALYADKELRKHALNAVALETARGWKLAKEKSSSKIDGLAALSFAALDAIERRPHAPLRPYEIHPEGRALSAGVMSRVF